EGQIAFGCPHVSQAGQLARSNHEGKTRRRLCACQRSRGGGTASWGDSRCRSASKTSILGSGHNRYGPESPVEARRLAFSSGGPFLASTSRRRLSRGLSRLWPVRRWGGASLADVRGYC